MTFAASSASKPDTGWWTTDTPDSSTLGDTHFTLHHIPNVDGTLGSVPDYNVRHDDALTLLILACALLLLIIIGNSMRTIKRYFKEFFFPSSASDYDVPSGITLLQFSLAIMTSVTVALCSFLYAANLPGFFIIDSTIAVTGLFTGLFAAYFLLKWLLYSLVNNVLFGSKKSLQWNHSFFFLSALEGGMMFPLVLMIAYLGLSIENALYYFSFVLILNKILSFYKSHCIFFRQKILFLQNILYFCALEMMPLLALSGAWLILAHFLKVNF